MNIFLVGGAVRDKLLKLPVKDKDYLVVGASPKQMLELGYTQVGKDFPVFLHPKTKEEYALARTERKLGRGYRGFSCDANENVTLEQDLLRRDLTINAIAEDSNGLLNDPYGGLNDLKLKCLRHISSAFTEDPLRVLRVARFAARLHSLGFIIAKDTMALMTKISKSGELTSLASERIWVEFEKALDTDAPHVFIDVLQQCGALNRLLPPLSKLYQLPATSSKFSNLGIEMEALLQRISELTLNKSIRFAAIMVKLVSSQQTTIEQQSELVSQLCDQLRVPNEYRELALITAQCQRLITQAFNLNAAGILSFFERAKLWRKPDNLQKLLLIAQTAELSATQGKLMPENKPTIKNYLQGQYLQQCFDAANNVEIKPIIQAGFTGQQIQIELKQQRTKAIAQVQQAKQWNL